MALVLRPAILTIGLAFALLAVGRAELPASDPQAQSRAAGLAGQTATITGRVADDSRPSGGGGEVLVEPERILIGADTVTGIGNLMVRWRGPTQTGFGDQVKATGKLMLPRDMPAFDRRAYLAQRHVYVELHSTSFNIVTDGSGPASFPAWLRTHYAQALNDALPPPHAGVLMGVVLGIRHGIPPALQNALIATGLVHLLVLSGLKVAVFARIVQAGLKPVLGSFASWPALALIALYAMVGGATPAAVRAAAMGGLVIAASKLGRPTHVWTSISLTGAAMLGWHPELAWDVGFQLSFAGTAAIILLTPTIERRITFMPAVLREPFAVTCAAQVGTVPMMATDFHLLSPIAPLTNALVIPILPVLITGGLLIGALSFIPELARLVTFPIAGLLAYLEQVAFIFARIPAAAIPIARFPTWMGTAYYSALVPAIAATQLHGRRRTLAAATAVLAPALIAATALGMWANAPPQAIVMGVGDGQAVLIRGPHGAILIDGGPSPARL
ncbi:MAG TPA: ComEC/Rec2 family competence protein, partial [Candidatus Dormibacteraeota bacterium]|nr:ComEC/Rec2 family competence protein [Candidatus Dormibacteraeota bacterium]